MMRSRRSFIKDSLAVTAGFTGLSAYLTHCEQPEEITTPINTSWLELPPGFEARIISQWGSKMSDGFYLPGRPDGMAAFRSRGRVVLIRNHENSPSQSQFGPFGANNELLHLIDKTLVYDWGGGETPGIGGTTTLVFNEKSQTVEAEFLSLIGTNRNCAGGFTPWNTWISCEEDVTMQGGSAEKFHGYNFEIDVNARGPVLPVPLKSMGRFNHEAVCVDPATGIVYQTEDRRNGLIYRFIPEVKGFLQIGGTLQALAIRDQPGLDTRNWNDQVIEINQELEVEWLTVDPVDTGDDDLRFRGFEQGAAVFARGEGMWFGNGEVYFACTEGGSNRTGQVFRYRLSPFEGTPDESDQPGKLQLFAEPNDSDLLKFCDNLTIAPWGDVILCEDGANAHIRGITTEGEIYNIGRNIGSTSELAGACFSPSGKTLFINIQVDGITLAITGPWADIRNI